MGQRSSTHVANAYHKDILVMVRGDTQYTSLEKIEIKADKISVARAKKYNWEYCEKNGYTKIAPHTYLRFYPEPASLRNNPFSAQLTHYVSIITEDEVVCKCFPVVENHSVIVDSKGYLRQTEMGTIWTDTTGKVHS